jgi:hypothetical protein
MWTYMQSRIPLYICHNQVFTFTIVGVHVSAAHARGSEAAPVLLYVYECNSGRVYRSVCAYVYICTYTCDTQSLYCVCVSILRA